MDPPYFFLLLDHNKLNLIKRLEGKLDLNIIHNHGLDTPLHAACWLDHYEIVKFLLKRGVDPDPKNDEGMSPLHCCSDVRIAKLLLERGADINAKDNKGNSILDRKCFFGHIEIIKLLLGVRGEVKLHPELVWKVSAFQTEVIIEYENGEPKCLSEDNCGELTEWFEPPDEEKMKEMTELILNYRMGKIKGAKKD